MLIGSTLTSHSSRSAFQPAAAGSAGPGGPANSVGTGLSPSGDSLGLELPADQAGLSAEAQSGNGSGNSNIGGLLSSMLSAFGGGEQPHSPLQKVQEEIKKLQEQIEQAEAKGDTKAQEQLKQKLRQLTAQLSQLSGQGSTPPSGSGGGAPSGESSGGRSGVAPATSGATESRPDVSPDGSSIASSSGSFGPSSFNRSSSGPSNSESTSGNPFAGGASQMSGNSNTPLSGDGSNQYDELIKQAAEKYGLDPNLLKSVIKQESGFKPDAKSPAGAQGLMQLMPGTAKELGVTNPMDPAQSIDGGAKYLAQQLKTFNGDVKKALAAYNAGAGNVKKHNGVPPFAETQKYVANITADYANRTAMANNGNSASQFA